MAENIVWKSKAENIVSEFFKSKKNSNCMLELEELLLSADEECIISTIPVVSGFFSKIFSMGLMIASSTGGQKEDAYRSWLLSRYEDYISHLLSYLSHPNINIQISALETLLLFVKVEGQSPRKDEKENQFFPVHLFKRIVSGLASDVLNKHHLIKIFQEYTKYYDVKMYLLKSVLALIEESHEVSEVFLQNCFFLLYSMKFPKLSDDDGTSAETFAYRSDKQQPFQLKEKFFRKLFSSVWRRLLSFEFSAEFLQKVLSAFNDNILPQLQNPCLMTDFLTNAYNKGGVLSLLALKGLYLLMDRYNLEYGDFFVKLYALLDKNIINGKFSSTFFELTNLFLSSTHLPAHMVAAFAKRLSRLSLISSTNNVLKILCLVSNLLVSHPSLGILIHQADGQDRSEDPFDMEAVDPAQSNAMKSSLWEIKVLQSHVNPSVCFKAKEVTAAYPKFPSDISDISSFSLQDIYKKSRKRKVEEVPLSIHRPIAKQKRGS